MTSHATAWVLAFATLVGPSLCCCTTTAFATSISRILGGEVVACPSAGCCHHQPPRRDKDADCSHGGHLRHEQNDAHSTPLTKQTDPAREQHPPRRNCPCRQHRGEIVALPVTVDVAGGVSHGLSDWAWATVALPLAFRRADPSHFMALHGPETACASGREILRAHCILRI